MKIIDILRRGRPSVSFEVFPPKRLPPSLFGDAEQKAALERTRAVVAELAELQPAFMSVTYGAAGGTTGANTAAVAGYVQASGVTALAHLTCLTASRDRIADEIRTLRATGIENVLCLRGDLPPGVESAAAAGGGFAHAVDLVRALRPSNLCLGGACYPERHPECAHLADDIAHLREKVDAGLDFLTTQMFFDNNVYFHYVARLRDAGITVPVVAGIMPVTNGRQIARICRLSGTSLPPRFAAIVDRFGDDHEAMASAGVAYATEQIVDLFAHGVNNVHVYTMNKPDVARRIMSNLKGLVGAAKALLIALLAGWTTEAIASSVCSAEPPPYPGAESWTFRRELAQPEAVRPVSTNGVVFRRGPVAGFESYRIDAPAGGPVTITTEDDEGLRRAVYYYQDRVRAGDLKSCVRKPWVRNRISRCFFGPIKRPPLNHDELMDDIDYYPEAYLDRLAREGVNGLWLTVEWRDLAETSFTRRSPDAPRRLAKLRATVERCRKYGIKTWIFCIEPKSVKRDDPLLKEHPELFGVSPDWNGRLMCASRPAVRRYIEESVADIFTQVPDLGGILMISHGERRTTCFSTVDSVTGLRGPNPAAICSDCAKREPWELHNLVGEAIVRGIRRAGSKAEYLSWMYQPYVRSERHEWVADVARHLPEGMSLVYNFESGAVRDQLGRLRPGGDYWLSYVGPADSFRRVAEAARGAGRPLGAKIQVGNSHEVATVPFVPVPGLLYRKYRAMREMGVSTVLQCWYFGNYPGVMNKAAGELSFDDFTDDEETFLKRLAAPEWGADAERMARIWRRLSDAYADYPLSNDMQYYGPFHAGVAWPLLPDVQMAPLGRTWKPQDAPSGDAIGECLENHTLEEACILSGRMARGAALKAADGSDEIAGLMRRYAGDEARLRDLGVIAALQDQFASAANIFSFYRDRATALDESRARGHAPAALAALDRMDAAVTREEGVTRHLLPLAERDSRLGFHSEAEAHQYHPAKLRWRLGELAAAHRKIAAIRAAVADGKPYPESDWERAAASCAAGGDWTPFEGGRFRVRDEANGDFTCEFILAKGTRGLTLRTFDAAGTLFWRAVNVSARGEVAVPPQGNAITRDHEVVASSARPTRDGLYVTFTLAADAWGGTTRNRPAWLSIRLPHGASLWPAACEPCPEGRLNIGALTPRQFGRVVRAP